MIAGVGLRMSKESERLPAAITEVASDGPSATAGLSVGLALLEVDGKDVTRMSVKWELALTGDTRC